MAFSITEDRLGAIVSEAFDAALREEIEREVELAKERLETKLRARAAAMAVALAQEVDVSAMTNRVVVTFKTKKD